MRSAPQPSCDGLTLETLRHDLRFAFRALLRQPAFSITAILTLALGIGANSAMFSVFNALVLRPLPFRDPDRLLFVWQRRPGGQKNAVAARDLLEWKKQARSFGEFTALATGSYNITGAGDPVQVFGARVSADFFSCLGVDAVLGRTFLAGEDLAGAARALILSHRFWQTQFDANANVLGHTIVVNGESYTVVGVLPASFEFLSRDFDIWLPLSIDGKARLDAHNLAVLGRLAPSATAQQADREMQVIAGRMASQFPESNSGWGVELVSVRDTLLGDFRPALLALLGSVMFVLLIACANVANLLLARAAARYKELAIRSVIGAGLSQLLRQLLTESVLLGLIGGAVGLALAYPGVRLASTMELVSVPRISSAAIDARVLGFTAAVSVLTGILFGLMPARRLLKGDLNLALRESGRSAIGIRGNGTSRNLLVVAEIALSLILLIGAGMMIRSFIGLLSVDRGFQPDHLLTFKISMPASRYRTPELVLPFYQRLIARIQALPGVEAVGSTTNLPIDGYHQVGMYFSVEGAPLQPESQKPAANTNLVNPAYFRTTRVPILQGRAFDDRDRLGAPPVVIISSRVASRFFPGQNPIGRHISVESPGPTRTSPVREVVGVAGDIRYSTRDPEDSMELYLPYLQNTWPRIHLLVRSRVEPESLISQARAVLRDLDPEQSVSDVRTMMERISLVAGKSRWNSTLASICAGLALALAAVGIYGVVSYSTAQRTQEIGVRMALGAQGTEITTWILRQAILLAAIGVALGVIGYLTVARLFQGLLYGTSPTDPRTIAAAAAILGGIAALASYLPARRAVNVDPVRALRAE